MSRLLTAESEGVDYLAIARRRDEGGDDPPRFDSCSHPSQELRWRTNANGVRVVVSQCLNCGSAVKCLPKKQFGWEADKTPPFDAELGDRYWKAREAAWDAWRERRNQNLQEANNDWWADYDAYRASRRWAIRRRLVLERDHHRCQAVLPGCSRNASEVHHLTYEHVGHEPIFDLIAVCQSCHDQITNMDRSSRRLLPTERATTSW